MARKRDRAFALFGAILFFATSLGLSFAVIWQLYKDGHQESNKQTSSTASSNKLQGTKLANFTPVAKVDSLQKIDTQPGTGSEVKAGETVTVEYTGALASNGVIFQSSKDTADKAIKISLDGVIEGWKEGIPGMKVGGTRRLLIPAAQAYGATAQNGIPANSDLVFDVTLDAIGE